MFENKPVMMSISAQGKQRTGVLIALVAASASGGCVASGGGEGIANHLAANATITYTGTPEERAELERQLQAQYDASAHETDSDDGDDDTAGSDDGNSGGGSTDPNDPNSTNDF